MYRFFFYIEPYVHSNLIGNHLLLYNTFNSKCITFIFKDKFCLEKIQILFRNEICRCIEINEKEIVNNELLMFIETCRNLFFADTTICEKSPILLEPNPKVNRNFKNIELLQPYDNKSIRNSFKELYLCIHDPDNFCSNGNLIEFGLKQVLFPVSNFKNSEQLIFEQLRKWLYSFDLANLDHLVIIGNIFLIDDNVAFFEFFKDVRIQLHLYYKNFDLNYYSKIKSLNRRTNTIVLWVDREIDYEKIEFILNLNMGYDLKFKVIVEQESDISDFENLIEDYSINCEFVPFYNNTNKTFFERFIYNTKHDLEGQDLSDRDIFSRMLINQLNFGKLIIMPDGKIYSNPNLKSIGNIDSDSLIEILKRVVTDENQAWLMTRNSVYPCDKCIYKFICTPISSYEYFINEMNLCTYNPFLNQWKGEDNNSLIDTIYSSAIE